MTNSVANYRLAASVGPRFVIAGIMLAVLAGWMKANHDSAPTAPVAIVAIAAALSFAWGVLRLRVSETEATAAKHTRASGAVALLGAVVLAGVGVWWSLEFKRDALGEILGLLVFAVIAAASGLGLLRSNAADPEAGWKQVGALQAFIGIAFATVGFVALAAFLYFAFVQKVDTNYVPDVVVLMMAGFILFFGGLYLMMSQSAQPSTETLRIVFLVIGSILGMLLIAESLIRAIDWRGVFSSTSSMSGSDAWQFWLPAYLFAVGLWLVAASSTLVLSQVRENADLRRFVGGVTAVALAWLVGVFLLAAIVLYSIKDPFTYNWSNTRGLTALSGSSKNLLLGLDKKVDVYVLVNPRSRMGVNLKVFLANCQGVTNKVKVEWIDSEKDERYKALANRFPEIVATRPLIPEEFGGKSDNTGRGVLLVYGPMPDDLKTPVPHAWIPDARIEEQKGDPSKPTFLFKGEPEIMKEIDFLARKREKRKLYFLQGDDELSIAANDVGRPRGNPSMSLLKFGVSKFVEKLKKDNFDVAGLSFSLAPPDDKDKTVLYLAAETSGKKVDVPDDCDTLIVAGPSLPIPQGGLDALERYMDRGGKMVVFLDVFADRTFVKIKETGLEDFLKKYGVVAPNEFLFRLPQERDFQIFGNDARDPTLVLAEVPEKAKTVLAKQFQETPIGWTSARVVKPGETKKYQVDPLLVVSPERCLVLLDDNPKSFVDLGRYLNDLYKSGRWKSMIPREDVPVAVTVSESGGTKPRMVVFGDAEFIQNIYMSVDPTCYDMARSSIEWMGERGFIGPSPKESSTFSLPRTVDLESMVYGTGWTMIVLIVVFGVGVWLVRRR